MRDAPSHVFNRTLYIRATDIQALFFPLPNESLLVFADVDGSRSKVHP